MPAVSTLWKQQQEHDIDWLTVKGAELEPKTKKHPEWFIAIKMLGTNGGGFFNANAAHPFENPTALANYVQIISIFALGAALTNVFGRMVGNQPILL